MRRVFKKTALFILLVSAGLFSLKTFAFFSGEKTSEMDFSHISKNINLIDNGLFFDVSTDAETVGDFLKEKNIKLGEHDRIIPDTIEKITPGMNIEIGRAAKIRIEVDGKTIENYTLEKNIMNALLENGITLGRLDRTVPDKNTPLSGNVTITVTRINIEEVVIPESIDFKTVTKLDSKMGWREKKTDQKGEKGIREVNYRITYKNGKEVSRVALSKNITKDPVPEIIIQGTYVKLGDKHTGMGTWYSFQGGLYAASPWLPIGSFAKVTNTANGKSVIVEINDRGPFGKNRIIDLDKQAFQKISDLGAGVISTKVEEVLN